MIKRNIGLLAVFIAVSIFAMGAAGAGSNPVTRTVLPNGLTVIIDEEHASRVVSIQMWVRVGSADETEEEAGLSHVFEHMLFKGTARRKVGEIAGAIESVGGDINAYTSFDKTVYHLTVPSRHFATGLDIISDAVQNSAFDPAELKKELEVVLEELRMNEDSPDRSLYKNVFSTAYTTHPYKRPTIGYEKVITGLKRETLLEFFRRWYIPNNMTLVIAGDVDTGQAMEAIRVAFKDYRPGKDPHMARPIEPPQEGFRFAVIPQEIKEPRFGLAFHIPELASSDTYAVDVAAGILGDGASSRLYKRLKMDKAIVHSVAAYAMSLKEPGLFMITGSLESKEIERAVPEILKEVKRLSLVGPNPDELQKIKTGLESDFIYSKETMDGDASKLGYFETIAGGLGFEKAYLDGIRGVSAKDVKRVLNAYVTDKNMSAVFIMPNADRGLITREKVAGLIKTAEADFANEAGRMKKTSDMTKVSLENGITLIIKEAHANPLVAFYAAFPCGLRHETPSVNGIGNFTAGMLTKGTKTRSAEALAKEVEGLAGGVSGFSGWNSVGASGKFLSTDFDKGLAIFADVVMNPSFDAVEMEKHRKDVLAAIKSQEDNLPSYTFKLMYKTLYKTHPYGMPVIGRADAVSGLTRADLVKHHETCFAPERMVLTIAGDVFTDYVRARATEAFKTFRRKGNALTPPLPEKWTAGVQTTGDAKTKEQTHIAIAFPGTVIGGPDAYALRVLAEVLAGQSGRLFVKLRDEQSLAYSVSAFSKEGVDPGIVGMYIGSAPEKKDAAINGILSELKLISTEKITPAELSKARNSLIGGYEIGQQDVASQAVDMANNELYGLGYDFGRRMPAKIEAVTVDDVLRVARKYLKLDSYVISVVGPNGSKTGEDKKR